MIIRQSGGQLVRPTMAFALKVMYEAKGWVNAKEFGGYPPMSLEFAGIHFRDAGVWVLALMQYRVLEGGVEGKVPVDFADAGLPVPDKSWREIGE